MVQRVPVVKTYKLYINGAFPRSESGRSLIVHSSKGDVTAHAAHASRKDLRDAVEAAASAQPKWAAASAYNRGQVMYRMAEMMEGKRDEFIATIEETSKRQNLKTSKKFGRGPSAIGGARGALGSAARQIDAAIDRLICFGGWCDKYAQILGCNNPVAGPYYNFTVPEPTGIVAVVAPSQNHAPALLGMISLLAPPLCAGNAIVVLAADQAILPAAILGEVCATSDVPAGVINILTCVRSELLDHIARHRNINAISAANLSADEAAILKRGVAENVKRVQIAGIGADDWLEPGVCENPWTIEPFIEYKTIWHPSAT